jgi:aliphatic nitrilase
MPQSYPRFKAAACHISSVFLDSVATIEKAVSFIREAAKSGAALVAFPESFVPGFPVWSALRAPIENHEFFRALAMQSIRRDGEEVARLSAAARESGIYVSVGISEGTDASVGCIWNSNLLIGPDGSILNHHRKLVPTFYEKLIWANGDARGLRAVSTEIGRVGMLICGENTNPLSRYTLMADGEQVHISTYPPIWPTRPPSDNSGYDLRRAIEIRAGAHAFEAKVFNIVSSAFADAKLIDAVSKGDPHIRETIERSPKSVSMVLDPTGSVISEVLSDQEGIVYAEVDTSLSVEPKQFHDVVGYYNRFDIFDLKVDRTAREPARFVEPIAAHTTESEESRPNGHGV